MSSNGTKKKTNGTKGKKASRSKTVSAPSATRKAPSATKSARAKSASNSQVDRETSSLQSSSPGVGKAVESYRRGQPRAENADPTWDDDGWENEGWSEPRKLTAEEHAKLRKAFDHNGEIRVRVIGRPRKPPEDKLNSKPFRISKRFEDAFKAMALENGFRSWQEWLRTLGAREAGLLKDST